MYISVPKIKSILNNLFLIVLLISQNSFLNRVVIIYCFLSCDSFHTLQIYKFNLYKQYIERKKTQKKTSNIAGRLIFTKYFGSVTLQNNGSLREHPTTRRVNSQNHN